MSAPFWVSVLLMNEVAIGKVGSKHGFRPEDVRDAVQCRPRLRATADTDPDRGLRYVLNVTIDGRRAVLLLKPVPNDVDVYRLVSVYVP